MYHKKNPTSNILLKDEIVKAFPESGNVTRVPASSGQSSQARKEIKRLRIETNKNVVVTR